MYGMPVFAGCIVIYFKNGIIFNAINIFVAGSGFISGVEIILNVEG